MADWDSEDFDPEHGFSKPTATDRWEGEDEEEVKGAWDESDEETKENDTSQETVKAFQVKKKKSLEATLKAKEEKRKKELAAQKVKEQVVDLSPEEQMAEKLRQQKLQEDSDLELAKEAFGVTDDVKGRIDAMQPTTAEEFEEFATLLKEKLQQLEKSPHYVDMLDNVFQGCSLSLEADQVKRLGSSLTAIGNEKSKAQKAGKTKKKGKKAVLAGSGKSGKGIDGAYEDGGYDDMDDFI